MIRKKELYRLLLESDVLTDIEDGPTCMMITTRKDKLYRLEIKKAGDYILATGRFLSYVYPLESKK